MSNKSREPERNWWKLTCVSFTEGGQTATIEQLPRPAFVSDYSSLWRSIPLTFERAVELRSHLGGEVTIDLKPVKRSAA